MVKSATIDLKLATKDYVVMETQRLRLVITSIVTVKVSSTLHDYEKGIVKDEIVDAVQSPLSLELMIQRLLSSNAVMKNCSIHRSSS